MNMRTLWNYLFLLVVIVAICVLDVDAKKKKKRKKKDPVDLTVVDDSTLQNSKTSGDGLPVDVNVNFEVLGSIVSLNLKRNPAVVSARDSVYVIRESKNGVPVLVSQLVNETDVYGEYQDPVNSAIFTLSCPKNNGTAGNSTSKCDATMEGTFRSNNEEYRMSLLEDTLQSRVRRAANKKNKKDKLWRKAKKLASESKKSHKVYGIFKTEAAQATPTDFKEAEPVIRGRVSEAFGRQTKVVRENALPGGRMYNVEVLVVIDYGLYERFYKASNAGTEYAKDNEAKYNLKKYFSHVFNGVDMLYKTIDDPDFTISVAVSGFVIADRPESSYWTTPHINRVREGRHELLVSIPLDELFRWSLSANNIPENDHIMLFTDYDLYSTDSGTKDLRTAGYARVSSVCSIDSVSVVEDHGGFQSINAAAHELGHALGSRHDGRLNTCNPSDQFIMTAHGGFETERNKLNPWRFSRCSIDYFKKYINTLPRTNCLSDPVDIFDRAEFLHYVQTYPGQDYTPNQQCQDILGLDSYYGWGPELGMFSNICTEMSCKVPGSGRSYRIYKAATGTSCGDKKWCKEGQCVFDDKAPPKDPQCVFGDIQRRFGNNKSCREYMLENPMRCYDSFYRTRCCETCDRLNTGVRGCEYGDKFLNCRSSGCWDPSYARDCCSTCGLAPPPVIRPVDPVTTRAPATFRPPTTRQPTFRPQTNRPTTRAPSTRRPTTYSVPLPTQNPGNGFTASGSSGMCIRDNANFLLFLSCSRLPSIFGPDACDNPLASRFCCEKCPAPGETIRTTPRPTTGCEDKPSCSIEYARECYIPSKKEACCRTCRRFETNRQGCEYGDRIRNCQRYVGELGLSYVCSRYGTYCCGLCGALAARTNSEPMNALAPSEPAKLSANQSPSNQSPNANPSISPELSLPGGMRPERVISAGGQRRGLGWSRGRGHGRGLSKGMRNEENTVTSNQSSALDTITQATSQNPRGRGQFIPIRTFVFRSSSPVSRAGPRERRPRGSPFIRRNILPSVNLVITSAGKK